MDYCMQQFSRGFFQLYGSKDVTSKVKADGKPFLDKTGKYIMCNYEFLLL